MVKARRYKVTRVSQEGGVFIVFVETRARLSGNTPFKHFDESGLLYLGDGWHREDGFYFRLLEIREKEGENHE